LTLIQQGARRQASASDEKGSSSFLKKHQKLLSVTAATALTRAVSGHWQQKFFGSFFQKRTAFLLSFTGTSRIDTRLFRLNCKGNQSCERS
jgi:hypothetical protein